ncbi:3-oxo-5-alpha-steroid 4-dehydrogenase 3 / polyprenol reductase [Entomortierella parvispora]|uniref:3-oxo-5-alpha-steroid 4-dehydrogenase 3 / polyprenol reductase n=1 Tax=Entomortierella parvispora TaxID=205924 RepID=A0A9P3HCJ9_9FUNG|nr:3-oxo-5-alpha-steroid 4-dehydrogenase 3 / polyprenol reductase [Entomortierella parvispora]
MRIQPPSFSQLIQLYYVLIITIAILAGTLPALRNSILTYGKLDAPANTTSKPSPSPSFSNGATKDVAQSSRDFVKTLHSFRVPKTWFAHFYVLAPLWMVYLTVDLRLFTSLESSHWVARCYPYFSLLHLLSFLGIMIPPKVAMAGGWIPPPEVVLAMSCYFAQVTRRWCESQFIERPSPKATLHVGHYIIGMTYYSAMAPTVWVDAYETWAIGRADTPSALSTTGVVQCLVGLGLFLWGSFHQYNCHVILADLRAPKTAPANTSSFSAKATSTEYKVPFGDWFQYMVAPHYSAEMVIYFGVYLMASARTRAPTMLIAWIWVVINLGIVARETDQWYRAHFGEQYHKQAVDPKSGKPAGSSKPLRKRAILVPSIY